MRQIHVASILLALGALLGACGADTTGMVNARGVNDDAATATDGATNDANTTDDGAVVTDGATGSDASAPDDAAAPTWTPPAGTNTACVSGTTWTRGNRGSQLMNPGQACIACHTSMREGPTGLGGTAYYLDHEMNNCNGYSGRTPGGPSGTAYVEIVDATGRTARLTVNSAGNFITSTRFTYPLRTARVIGPTGLVNEMSSPVPNGDCNSCHTQDGTTTVAGGDSAPGRIVVPL